MSTDPKKLYELLPSVYRIRDAKWPGGERPLRELIALLSDQVQEIEESLRQMYDDQFIETCAEWVVPYIGDLIGYRLLDGGKQMLPIARAEVANTIGYRRRKGTASMLEKLAHDVTGWDARVVEFFQLLATTQYMNHVRPENLSMTSVRTQAALEKYRSPFESFAHLAEVRPVRNARGRYNIPNVGIFLWRLRPYSATGAQAVGVDKRRFLFNPLGTNTQLFTKPEPEGEVTHLAEEINVPAPIRRRALHNSLSSYYGADKSIFVQGMSDTSAIAVCNLSDRGPANKWGHLPASKDMAIDPVLGRIHFRKDQPEPPFVVFHYAFSSDIGGGEYERRASFMLDENETDTKIIKVPGDKPTIHEALGPVQYKKVIIEITDNRRYQETLSKSLLAVQTIEIRAANGKRPLVVLQNPFVIKGNGGQLALNGLVVSGDCVHVKGSVESFSLRHCTLVPGVSLSREGAAEHPEVPSLKVEPAAVRVEIDQSILGGVRLNGETELSLTGSILDATDETLVALAGLDGKEAAGVVRIKQSTVIGKVHVVGMPLVCNSILFAALGAGEIWPGQTSAPVVAEKTQVGCVRFSHLPWNSRVPRRHRCYPGEAEQAEQARSRFNSLRYGRPAYCQLSSSCPQEIRRGADDGSEMGVFHDLFQPIREANLRVRLEEYLRFGLEAGIFYQT